MSFFLLKHFFPFFPRAINIHWKIIRKCSLLLFFLISWYKIVYFDLKQAFVSNRNTTCRGWDAFEYNREHESENSCFWTRREGWRVADSEDDRSHSFRARVPSLLWRHAGWHTSFRIAARSVGDGADDLENPACEWRGDARTMRGISVLNFARRSWQRVTRRGRAAGCSAAGCNDVWLWPSGR